METTALIVVWITAMTFAGAIGYAIGHKDGQRQGYTRGRSVSRHISTAAKAVK
jgi:hypothetical protein